MPQTAIDKDPNSPTFGLPIQAKGDIDRDPSSPTFGQGTPDTTKPTAHGQSNWLDTAIALANTIPGLPHPDQLKLLAQHLPEWLPTIGGAAGGVIGGAGGTAFGMGVGGVPGAIGGAALGGAAGESARQLIQHVTGAPEAPQSTRQAASQIGTQAAIQGGSELLGQAATPIIKNVGAALVQSAIKPGVKATAKAIARGVETSNLPVVKTLIKEGVNVSPGGIAKLQDIITASNDDVANAVAGMTGKISPLKVAGRNADLMKRVATQVNPTADMDTVKKVTGEFLTQAGTTKPAATGTGIVSRDLTGPEAQAMKQGTYRALKDRAYGTVGNVEVEAQKNLARGLKEELEAEAARNGIDLSVPNAREGAAIVAKEAIAKRLASAGNRDPVGLAWLAHNPATGLLYLAEKSPAVKSFIGRGLYDQAAKVSGVPVFVLRSLVSALAQSGEGQEPQK